MRYKSYSYSNATTPSGDEHVPTTTGESVYENDGKVWTWFDKFFGVADQSVDIWDRIRTPVPDDPYATKYGMGHPGSNNTLLIVGGLLVAGIVVYAVVKK